MTDGQSGQSGRVGAAGVVRRQLLGAGIGAGARHYLVKPVKLSALEDMVKSILKRA